MIVSGSCGGGWHKSLTLDIGGVLGTKRTTTLLLAAIVILIIGAAAAGVLLNSPSHSTSSSTPTGGSAGTSQSAGGTGVGPFKITYDQVLVGYQGGLWNFGIQGIGSKPIKSVTVILSTPTQSEMCTGVFKGGLSFANCPASVDPVTVPFPANSTFTGYTSGAGAGSATIGNSYTVIISAVFADGTSVNDTISVQAVSAA
jgi:hypothetical protein